MRLLAPDPDVLTALHGSGIKLILGTLNADFQPLATDPAFAANWIQAHTLWVVPAMQNMDRALFDAHVSLTVPTAVSMSMLWPSSMPSQGVFSDVATSAMSQVIGFLVSRNYPLLLNVYPYFAYDPANMRLEYAILNSTEMIVQDGELGYTNLLHAMVDTVYTAMEKVDGVKAWRWCWRRRDARRGGRAGEGELGVRQGAQQLRGGNGGQEDGPSSSPYK